MKTRVRKRHSWREYNFRRKQIEKPGMTPAEIEEVRKQLAERLRL